MAHKSDFQPYLLKEVNNESLVTKSESNFVKKLPNDIFWNW